MGFAFHRPESLDAAIAIAREHSETARLLAGGTDLHHPDQPAADRAGAPDRPGWSRPRFDRRDWSRGRAGCDGDARCRGHHPGFREQFVALTEASAVIGGWRERNIATMGGNIVNASSAEDLVSVLLALDATVELRGRDGTRSMPLDRFLVARGRPIRGRKYETGTDLTC